MRSKIIAAFLVLYVIATVYCDNTNDEARKKEDKNTLSNSKETTSSKNSQSKLAEGSAKNLIKRTLPASSNKKDMISPLFQPSIYMRTYDPLLLSLAVYLSQNRRPLPLETDYLRFHQQASLRQDPPATPQPPPIYFRQDPTPPSETVPIYFRDDTTPPPEVPIYFREDPTPPPEVPIYFRHDEARAPPMVPSPALFPFYFRRQNLPLPYESNLMENDLPLSLPREYYSDMPLLWYLSARFRQEFASLNQYHPQSKIPSRLVDKIMQRFEAVKR